MAKQTKSVSSEPTAQADSPAAAPKATRPPRGENDLFKIVMVNGQPNTTPSVKNAKEETVNKVAPQCQTIINAIAAAGDKGILGKDLNKQLETLIPNSRQPRHRLVTYYRKQLVESGCVTITSGTPAAEPAK